MDSAIDEPTSSLGYSDVKAEQREAIEDIASGHKTTIGQPYRYLFAKVTLFPAVWKLLST